MKHSIPYRGDYRLAYVEYGDRSGFPVLVQHGLIASIDDYALFDRLIDLGVYLIAMARPGYGDSSPYPMTRLADWADLVAVVVDRLKLRYFDVLGISSGAPYSYAIGWRFPNQVRNLYILSGIPALYDDAILAHWPYPANRNASLAELESLAHELFFAGLSDADLARNDIRDSMRYHYFGIAQDLKLRCVDWGFTLADVQAAVYMWHSRFDGNVPLVTAEMTARLLPNCRLEIHESDDHFSPAALNDFIETVMAPHYR